jgi:hypothetical protein
MSLMSGFELVEFKFSPDDFNLSLEDEFLMAKITKELEAVKDPDVLRAGALKLLQLAVHRQAIIRSLVARLANLEADVIKTYYEE